MWLDTPVHSLTSIHRQREVYVKFDGKSFKTLFSAIIHQLKICVNVSTVSSPTQRCMYGYVRLFLRVYMHACVCIYLCMSVYVYLHVCVCVCVCVCAYRIMQCVWYPLTFIDFSFNPHKELSGPRVPSPLTIPALQECVHYFAPKSL